MAVTAGNASLRVWIKQVRDLTHKSTIEKLIANGVTIPSPDTVSIDSSINADSIERGASLMPGSRVSGADTVIGAGSVIGSEGPATVRDCQIGRNVTLGSGFFAGSVFFDGSSMGGGAHVRPGCILEEQASGAHTVGLKQTVLLPFVTLGSLINFCDCLMAGGTGRKNHSEVGSSYIHFNFTPNQDKATASLIGDVVRGVLLDQSPIFLGGQGGMVGPVRIAYGSVIPAGQVIRRDVSEPGKIVAQNQPLSQSVDFDQRIYGSITHRVRNSFSYIAHIHALKLWYENVRTVFAAGDANAAALCSGGISVLNTIIAERVKRLGDLGEKLEVSALLLAEQGASEQERANQQKLFADQWPELKFQLEEKLKEDRSHSALDQLKASLNGAAPLGYLDWVAGLDDQMKQNTVTWLGDVVLEIEKLGTVE